MKDYFKLLNIDANLGREDILTFLYGELRTWTNRASNPIKEKRDKAEDMVTKISEAIEIFSDQARYNDYINQLNQNRNQGQEQKGQQKASNQQPKAKPQAQTMTVDQVLDNAMSLFGYNDDAALKQINDVISRVPNYPRPWLMLAGYYKRKNNIDQAIAIYNRILSFSQNNYIASYNLFIIYCARGMTD